MTMLLSYWNLLNGSTFVYSFKSKSFKALCDLATMCQTSLTAAMPYQEPLYSSQPNYTLFPEQASLPLP